MSRRAIWTPPTGGWCWICCWSTTAKAGATLVLVTHDPEIASRADRKIVLKDGMLWWKTRCLSTAADDAALQEAEQGAMAKRALSWRRAAAIGWRDLKSAPGKFAFVVLSVAVGVAALVGVRGFSESFKRTLTTEARSLMAGDLSARIFRMPTQMRRKSLQVDEAEYPERVRRGSRRPSRWHRCRLIRCRCWFR